MMNNTPVNNIDKASRFLTLFGLHADFTAAELVSAYHTLAKLNHPDLTHDPESAMRMVIINEGYRY
ncbi:MAG TPA: J domain-containing protein, partial [Spirochaetota bacterium]